MDDIIKDSNKNGKGLCVGYKNMQRVMLSECAFADDLIITAGNERDMQKKPMSGRKYWIDTT